MSFIRILWDVGEEALNEILKQLVINSYLKMRKPLRGLSSSFLGCPKYNFLCVCCYYRAPVPF